MAIYETYSKRQKRLGGEIYDVYTYDNLPEALQNQIIHIWKDTIGIDKISSISRFTGARVHEGNISNFYKAIINILCKEHGLLQLHAKNSYMSYENEFEQLIKYFNCLTEIEKQIDVIELTFRMIDIHIRQDNSKSADEAIYDLNTRFKEHGVGYQYIDGDIIRIDSEYIHAEAMKPALTLLHDPCYGGVQDEFLKAHEHYRHGRNKEALIECCKAFESTMKAICDKRGWAYEKTAAAKTLIKICLDNNLIPSFSENQFNALRTLLESSIPTIRNKMAGHGQGVTPTNVPDHITAYALHMTASTLVFLITAEKNTP